VVILNKALVFLLLTLVLYEPIIEAQDLPPCGERDYLVEYPRVIPELWCIELPLVADEEWSFTSLAFTEDGSFYATNPHRGLLALLNTNGDQMPDAFEGIADNLQLPNGLAVEGNTLYILGDGAVYAYEAGAIRTVADDLPSGLGFMARGIAVQDGRIYLGIPFPCDVCEADNELYGTVLSMDSNGENREIVARGLRYPAGLAFYDGALWVTDTARDAAPFDEPYDEINRIDLGAEVPHFGFPYCIGIENQPDFAGDFDCTSATPPSWIMFAHNNPLALDTYEGDAFPWLHGQLLISMGGSFDNSVIRGYTLVAARELDDGRLQNEVLFPADNWLTFNQQYTQIYVSEIHFISVASAEQVNQRGAGIWPHRLYDMAESPEGWIYFSVGGEGIYVLRPSDTPIEDICRNRRQCD
jgi:glucose/arabinose dehydrogenase